MNRFILTASLSLLAVSGVLADESGRADAGAGAGTSATATADRDGARASGAAAGGGQARAGDASADADGQGEFSATLDRPLSTRRASEGDEVSATLDEDLTGDGELIAPRGARLLGRVTESSPRGREGERSERRSRLGIVFDRVQLDDGREVPVELAIAALATADAAAEAGTRAGAPARDGAPVGRAGSATSGAGGLAGGVAGTARGLGGAASATAGGAGRAVTRAGDAGLASSADAVGGLDAAGRPVDGSRGVFGLRGTELVADAGGGAEGSVIASTSRHLRLDGGTRLLLAVGAQADTD